MNFSDLTKKIKDAKISTVRMSDIKTGTYHIDPSGTDIYLVSDKKQKIRVTENALASLRIVEDPEKAKLVLTTRDARDSEQYKSLQDAVNSEEITLSEDTKFNVVHRLKVIDAATEKPTYRNECYTGYPEYLKAARKAGAMPHVTTDETDARNLVFSEASAALRKTELKLGITEDDKHLNLIPVFQVSKK